MKIKFVVLSALLLIANTSVPIIAEEEPETPEELMGMEIMTVEQVEKFNESLPYILDAQPNSIAMERTNTVEMFAEIHESNNAANIGEEILYVYPDSSGGGSAASSNFKLAESVDITESLTFPAIGDQIYNSCVSWSLVYYQLTNNTCLVRGKEARNSDNTNIAENVFNPYWTYSLTNGGANYLFGTFFDEACAAIMSYGVPTYSECPDTILNEWSTNSELWKKAMKNKPMQISYADIETTGPVTGEDPDIIKLKKILSNGYVVTIPTVSNAMYWTHNTSNGEYACKYTKNLAENKRLGHALTVVGYDDNMWIDINGNNSQDSGEYGAFKIANSWGLDGQNCSNGCFWIAYDAIGVQSGVANTPSITRAPAFEYYYLIHPKKNYDPLYIANVCMSAKDRNQISVSIGISGKDATEPVKKLNVANHYGIAFNNANQSRIKEKNTIYGRTFSGNSNLSEETITIPFDITPIIKKIYNENKIIYNPFVKIYITVSDNTRDGEYTYLKDVSVTETATNKTICSLDTSILNADNSSVTKTVVFEPTTSVNSYKVNNRTLYFTNEIEQESITDDNLYLTDYEGNKLNVLKTVSGNKITILPDNETNLFETDSIYMLTVKDSILSVGRNNLINTKQIPIYNFDKYYEYIVDEQE